jgi:hypothetical protein
MLTGVLLSTKIKWIVMIPVGVVFLFNKGEAKVLVSLAALG